MGETFELRLSNMLESIDKTGVEGFDDSKIEELEALLFECINRQRSDEYVNQVADGIYDTLYEMLKQVKPESGLLSDIWDAGEEEINEYTDLLESHPMMSIETAKSYDCKALNDFIARMPEGVESYFASYKINGHGIRVVFKDGHLVSATSRARSSQGRDLTRQARIFIGEYNESLADYGLVELRGEACLKIENLEKARMFNPTIKSPFSAVSSLIKPSATEEECSLLEFLCYGFICDGYEFETREDEFQEIQNCGFNTPTYMLVEGCDRDGLLEEIFGVVEAMEESYDEFGYYCDGVVFEINDRELFDSMGIEGNHRLGNVALKVGIWKQDMYAGYVQCIYWKRGKSKLSPVAIVANEPDVAVFADSELKLSGSVFDTKDILNFEEMGVITAQGNSVKRVPLYEPRNILLLESYVGKLINFRYGGEAGVVPCFKDGRMLSEDAAVEILNGGDAPWDFV